MGGVFQFVASEASIENLAERGAGVKIRGGCWLGEHSPVLTSECIRKFRGNTTYGSIR